MNEANTMADILGPVAEAARFPTDPKCPSPGREEFSQELRRLINRYSREQGSDTPDFILADYLVACLDAYGAAVKARDKWFDFDPWARRGPRLDER